MDQPSPPEFVPGRGEEGEQERINTRNIPSRDSITRSSSPFSLLLSSPLPHTRHFPDVEVAYCVLRRPLCNRLSAAEGESFEGTKRRREGEKERGRERKRERFGWSSRASDAESMPCVCEMAGIAGMGRDEGRERLCASRGREAEESSAEQPPSIWPPTQQTALSALKSLAVPCPMWQPLTGVPVCRKLGH
ncbi:unnamed protein product [Pleuronectes platessa]|uniref:Uncharacterized protein n=1 Tax=Pleuronectes platessa TaxID=8262 RepID=A0A9N7TX49_PLEPL|nr:unnamed protein product [Pleuronectes platessa]